MTTEKWLRTAWLLAKWYVVVTTRQSYHTPVQVSVGYFPEDRPQPLAHCYPSDESADGKTVAVFFSPFLVGDHSRVTTLLATMVHENIHVLVGVEHGHGRHFQEIAKACGLTPPYGRVQPSQMSPELRRWAQQKKDLLGRCPWVAAR